MKTYQWFTGPALVVLASLMALGCATTRIDVDVYKGPLANHESVQIEQMAVMAVGAQPLLVQLREIMERREDETFKTADLGPNGLKYMDYNFKDPDARRVNEILYLYENRIDPDIAELKTKAKQAAIDYVNAYKVLQPKDNTKRKSLWGEFFLSKWSAARLVEKLPTKPDNPDKFKDDLEKLIQFYKNFFVPKEHFYLNKEKFDLFETIQDQLEKDRKLQDSYRFFYEVEESFSKKDIFWKEARSSSNLAFLALAESNLVDIHGLLLFPEKKESRKKFISEVKRTARSFIQARQALDDLLAAIFKIIVLLDEDCTECRRSRCRITPILADYASTLIQLRQFHVYEYAVEKTKHSAIGFRKKSFEELKKEFKDSFLQHAAQTAERYLEKHQDSKNLTSDIMQKIKGLKSQSKEYVSSSWTTKSGWTYGIARGPHLDSKEVNIKELAINRALAADLDKAFSGLGGSFFRGRHDLGLYHLIETYIDAAYEHPGNPDETEVKQARIRLQESLVHFADKVLRLANNSDLLKAKGRNPVPGIQHVDSFVAVLQSVGNSILIQADELRFRSSHMDQLDRRRQGEIHALEKTFYLPPGDQMADIIQSFQENYSVKVKEADRIKEKLDELASEIGKEKKKQEEFSVEIDGLDVIQKTALILSKAGTLDGRMDTIQKQTQELLEGLAKLATIIKPPERGEQSGIDNGKKLDNLTANTKAAGAEEKKDRKVDPLTRVVMDRSKTLKDFIDGFEKDVMDIGPESAATYKNAKRPGGDVKTVVIPILDSLTELDVLYGKQMLEDLDQIRTHLQETAKISQCLRAQKKNDGCKREDGELKSNSELGKELETVSTALEGLLGPEKKLSRDWVKLSKEIKDAGKEAKDSDKWAEAVKDHEIRLNGKREALAELMNQLRESEKKQKKEETNKTDIEKEKKQWQDAVRVVSTYRDKWLKNPEEFDFEGSTVVNELIARITAEIPSLSGQERSSRVTALELLKGQKVTFITMGRLDRGEDQNAKDVLDQLITQLNYRYIKALAGGGKDSPAARHIRQAMDAAYAYRSGSVYIRPASSYLRSSYAATSLQGGPGLRQQNLLAQHALRNIPLFGTEIYNSHRGLGDANYKIISGIDKQFWQNINRVQVSGTGKTNYVIAKDDIGNWYVKNYAADPGPVIQGAESLAAYTLGNKMGTNLLERVTAARKKKTAQSVSVEGGSTALEKVLGRYTREHTATGIRDLKYLDEKLWKSDKEERPLVSLLQDKLLAQPTIKIEEEKVKEALALAASAVLPSVAEAIRNALPSGKDEIRDKVKNAKGSTPATSSTEIHPLLDAITDDPENSTGNLAVLERILSAPEVSENQTLSQKLQELKDVLGDPDPGSRIVDGLHGIRRFYNQLIGRLAGIQFNKGAIDAEKQKVNTEESKPEPDEAGLETAKAALAKAEQSGRETSAFAKRETNLYLKAFLEQMADRRQEAVNAYEARISFLGEVAAE